MLARAAYDLGRLAGKIIVQLWPLWLFWIALHLGSTLWRDVVLAPQSERTSYSYHLLYGAWPSVGLAGPILLMLAAIAAWRAQIGSRPMAVAGICGAALATLLTVRPEWMRLSPYFGRASASAILGALDMPIAWAFAVGVLACGAGVRLVHGDRLSRVGRRATPELIRASSDTYGHADWLGMKALKARFPGPDPAFGGIVVGEAYRVDLDRSARGLGRVANAFDPADRRSWGQGGRAPLLIDPCRAGSTHALVLAGSGGFKTTSIGVPTLLHWTASAVVLDPSREVGPMVAAYRERTLGQRVVTLDPGDPGGEGFNVLDWIDIASPLAESHVEAVASWLAGEPPRAGKEGGAEFFRDMGKSLIACILADVLWDDREGADRSLRRVRQVLVTPEADLRAVLGDIHAQSPSPLARDLASTLKGLVAETFSGVYANAGKATRWLSTRAYAELVSGDSFKTRDLCDGGLSVFVQIPLKVLQSTPGLGRVMIGALLNAAYEADGQVSGRILFLLDEVARLGPMGVIETARDAGRKYGLTLLLLYQSVGQLEEQWGRDGARAWYDSTSWRLYAAVQDPQTARELSQVCGEYGVVASSHGDTAGASSRGLGVGHSNTGRSETRSEVKRALIKPEELLQDTRADEAFVIVRGSPPIRCGRAIYFRRPEMAAAVAPSRFHFAVKAPA